MTLTLAIGLLASIFLLFYIVTGGRLPQAESLKEVAVRLGIPSLSAIVVFLLMSALFQTKLVGAVWAILGWLVPIWGLHAVDQYRQENLRGLAKNLITSMGGLYAAGQTTAQAVATCAQRMPEPFQADLQDILGRHKLNPYASFPRMFEDLGRKYGLPELGALAAIVAAAETAGGPPSAAKGLKRLGYALRLRDKLRAERRKTMYETYVAAYVVIALLTFILFAWGFVGIHLFDSLAGQLVLVVSSAMIIGMIVMTTRLSGSTDIGY